ncbi:hypothetical protein HII36_08780 [Nonomuraea sp. NN258]|uniref:hypothetical protein n=1 Tax=Nonomuraea antri TaxID=2730852 RepID=UPI00156A0469|nr:hypothetical protein [Nonomuraea antri]NRQ31933.1 hypothetical protein [Nonomuraea antri]
MPKVLTERAAIGCAHQGTIQPRAGQDVLRVGGGGVLVAGDLEGEQVSGCRVEQTNSTSPCRTVLSMITGTSATLTAGGRPVLLETAHGLTDGLPSGTWHVRAAGQSILDAS